MPEPTDRPDRRAFLKRIAQGAAVAIPLFTTLGASAAESEAFERAQDFLNEARRFVTRAQQASNQQARQRFALDAESELTEALTELEEATQAERNSVRSICEALEEDIDLLLDAD